MEGWILLFTKRRHFLDDPFLFRFGTEVGKLVRSKYANNVV